MYKQIQKPKENNCRAAANTVAHKKSNRKQGFGFVHNRPESSVQGKLQMMVKVPTMPLEKNNTMETPVMKINPHTGVIQKFDPDEETSHLARQAGKWRPQMFWHSTEKKRRDMVLKNILKEANILLSSKSVSLISINSGGSGMTPSPSFLVMS